MITAEKIRIYARYHGDIDGWARAGSDGDSKALSDQDWDQISELLQRLAIERSGLAAPSYLAETTRLLAERVADPIAVDRLRDLRM